MTSNYKEKKLTKTLVLSKAGVFTCKINHLVYILNTSS